MAQLQFSEIGITNLRGRIAGTQFQGVRSGPQGTRPTIPRQPFSAPQEFSQNQFQQVLAQWSQLTEGQRTDWDEAAELPDWERTNKVGETYQPTGQSLFVQLNLSAFKQSFPIEDPPTYPTFTTAAINGLVAVAGAEIEVSNTASSITEDEIALFFTTNKLSAGRMSVNQREYFFTDNFDSETFSDLVNISAQYVARWGEGAVGQKIFVRGELLHYPSGARLDMGWAKAIFTAP